jgi:hypothetical protein
MGASMFFTAAIIRAFKYGSLQWYFLADVSGQPIGSVVKGNPSVPFNGIA